MKRLFIIIAVSLVSLLALNSCEKSEPIPVNLEGTTWQAPDVNCDAKGEATLVFESNGKATLTISSIEVKECTYTYSKPNLSLSVDGNTYDGKVDCYRSGLKIIIKLPQAESDIFSLVRE